MKKLILIAGVATLTACADTAVENEAPAEDAAVEEVAEAPTAPDGGTVHGTYSIRDMDGNEVGRTTINEDMTYTWASADGSENVSGTFRISEEGPCFDPEGEEEEVCYPGDSEAAEDGSWPSHDTEGNVTGTVIRVDA